MKRPNIVHFLAIATEEYINIKASITMKHIDRTGNAVYSDSGPNIIRPKIPIHAYRLLKSYEFKMEIIGLDDNHKEIYRKSIESDYFGNLYLKIPMNKKRKKIAAFKAFEIKKCNGIDMYLGTFIPIKIDHPKKIIICDFDKTLVDTKYTTTKEVYKSLTSELEKFPSVESSIKLVKKHINQQYHPFILSSAPHFYEDAIRDWLYKNNIFTACIFLKDLRQLFSIWENSLTPKDFTQQETYKLNSILDILLMTGPPNELVLTGDNFESDPIVYLVVAKLLLQDMPPWQLWRIINKLSAFKMNRRQSAHIIGKLYHSATQIKKFKMAGNSIKLSIYIRQVVPNKDFIVDKALQDNLDVVKLYDKDHMPTPV